MDNPTHSTIPRPDPTELTTQMVLREVSILDDRFVDALVALKELTNSRLEDAVLVRDEKFKAIDDKLNTAENLRIEQKGDSKTGLDAALAAQKEAASEQNKSNTLAISKSEASTSETITKLAEQFKTTMDGIIGQINDVKDRITKVEAIKVGATEQRAQTKDNVNMVYVILGIVVTLSSMASLAIALFK